jgi:hypothetical protein
MITWKERLVHYVAKGLGLLVHSRGIPLGSSRNVQRDGCGLQQSAPAKADSKWQDGDRVRFRASPSLDEILPMPVGGYELVSAPEDARPWWPIVLPAGAVVVADEMACLRALARRLRLLDR